MEQINQKIHNENNRINELEQELKKLKQNVKGNAQKQQPKKKNKNKQKKLNPQGNKLGINTLFNKILQKSAEELHQTYFKPEAGIFRGTCKGLEETCLSLMRGSFTMTTTVDSPVLTFGVLPHFINISAALNSSMPWFGFARSAAGTYNNPMLGTPVTGQTKINGPWNDMISSTQLASPALEGRVVCTQIKIIPTSNLTIMSGAGAIAYYTGSSGVSGTQTSLPLNTVNQSKIVRTWDGKESICLNWVPSGSETEIGANAFATTIGTAASTNSCFLGYLDGLSAATYRVEYIVGVEYVPRPDLNPLLNPEPPTAMDDAHYFINQELKSNWRNLVIQSVAAHTSNFMKHTKVAGGWTRFVGGGAGIGGELAFDRYREEAKIDDYNPSFDEIRSEPGVASRLQEGVRRGLCNLAEAATGYPVCDMSTGELARAAGRELRSIGRGGTRDYSSPGFDRLGN